MRTFGIRKYLSAGYVQQGESFVHERTGKWVLQPSQLLFCKGKGIYICNHEMHFAFNLPTFVGFVRYNTSENFTASGYGIRLLLHDRIEQ